MVVGRHDRRVPGPLGGTADNVVQRAGPYGYGLFPIDSTKPVDIHVPETLLIPIKWVREDGPDLVTDEEFGSDARIREFFTRYQRAFSWGRDGRRSALSWFELIASLPEEIRRHLDGKLGLNLPQEERGAGHGLSRFLATRSIIYHDEPILMPVLELVNHAPHMRGFDTCGDGVRVRGVFTDEILVCYSLACDSLGRFVDYGFVCDEKKVFSLPLRFHEVFGTRLVILRQTEKRQGPSGVPLLLPTVESTAQGIVISHVQLGNEFMPRVSRSIFRRILPQFSPEQADEAFERIRAANIHILVNLLGELEGRDSQSCSQLRAVVRMQVSALAGSFGVRDLDTLPV
jgi:hypothetical protein